MNTLKTTFLLAQILLFNCVFVVAQNTTEADRIIKVLSFNILHGATMNKDFNLDVIAKVIKDADPDFVALQEVDYKTNRAKKYDLVTELGWRTKMAPLFGRAMDYDDGEYGEGILSKHTFLFTRNVPLPYSTGNEPRAALEITTVIPSGDTISIIGTHLDHLKDNTDRVKQVKEINRVFSNNKYPTILTGDLNDLPGSEPISILEEIWSSSYDKDSPAPTFPSLSPTKKIDYVMFYPKNRWQVLDRQVIQDSIASDHCAYLVTLKLRKE
jgi:endonuclease/exonuclease/phosphatase family metal-dependent hydrolase